MKRLLTCLALPFAIACIPPEVIEPEVKTGLGVLGFDSHSIGDVELEIIASAADGLNGPRDLDFNPEGRGELWIVNRLDDSTSTIFDIDSDQRSAVHIVDPFAMHFMEEVSALSFSTGEKFGTCQESRNTYNNQAAPNDFMGPSLWSSDLEIYGISNPEAVQFVGFDLGSHLDMLHESPNCMGIAWAGENVYFTFDGATGSISRYDFVQDHGVGFDDHSDGVIERYTEAQVSRVPGVPSHLVYDAQSETVYIADTGNARILVLDAKSGVRQRVLVPMERGVELYEASAAISTFIDTDAGEFVAPSGLALRDGILYVADNGNSRISAFDLDGERIDYVDTELEAGSLMGIRVDDLGRLVGVDHLANEAFRLSQIDSSSAAMR